MKQYLTNGAFAEPSGGWGAYFEALGIPKSHIPANLFDSSFVSPLSYSTVPNNPIPTDRSLIPSGPVPAFNVGGFGAGGGSAIPITVNALNPSARGVRDGIIQGLREIGVKI